MWCINPVLPLCLYVHWLAHFCFWESILSCCSLQFRSLLLQFPECWDYSHVPRCLSWLTNLKSPCNLFVCMLCVQVSVGTWATVDVWRSEGSLRCWMSLSSTLFETESLLFSSACARLAALGLPEFSCLCLPSICRRMGITDSCSHAWLYVVLGI